MKLNYKLFAVATVSLLISGLSSCSNELKTPDGGAGTSLNNPVITPQVIAWSGNQTFTPGLNGNPVTRGEHDNNNSNEWADPDKEYGGWLVPDPLTDGQKERVKAYFQANPNLDYVDPNWNNFFVQQVYKGSEESAGDKSPEIYKSANGVTNTSDNMDLMTVGESEIHIEKFNRGWFNNGNPIDVLDNGQKVNGGTTHKDEITLMVNIDDTSCFGYHETNGSKHHNDKAALVSAEVIDAWAKENGNPGESVVDRWKRSFLGFDLELLTYPDMVASGFATYQAGVEQPKYIWDGENVIEGREYSKSKGGQDIPQEWEEYLIGKDGKPLPFASANTNMYLGEKISKQQSEVKVNKDNDQNQNVACLDMTVIQPLIDQGYIPVLNTQLCDWVKIKGGDGYYSDWIVCLAEAKKIGDKTDTPEQEQPKNDKCEKCHDPNDHHKNDGYCSDCDSKGEGECATPKGPGNTPGTGTETPEPDQYEDAVCEWCRHAITWDPNIFNPLTGTYGMYVHSTASTNHDDNGVTCGLCDQFDGDHICDYPEPRMVTGSGSNQNVETSLKNKEVEINLSINDVHKLPNGVQKYDIADLVSKLSIHVRYGHDVEVIMPVPSRIYCDQDDLYILQNHKEGMFEYGVSENVVEYDIVEIREIFKVNEEGNPVRGLDGKYEKTTKSVSHHVELHVEFVAAGDSDDLTTDKEGYIQVWTVGITPSLIRYLKKTNGDGINFEIYNYYNRGTQYTIGNYDKWDEHQLQEYLNHSFVTFDFDTPETEKRCLPDFYINAFNDDRNKLNNGEINEADCFVWIVGDDRANYKGNRDFYNSFWAPHNQKASFHNAYQGTHYNGSIYNWIFTNTAVPGSSEPTKNPMPDYPWPFEEN